MQQFKKFEGFSLIETIIIIAIIAIVSILVLPNVTTMLNQNQVTQQSHDFVTAIQLALSESETNGNKISICAKNSASDTCVAYTTAPDLTMWRNGWLIFSDKNDNGIYDSTDTLIRVQANSTNTLSINAPASSITVADGKKVTRGVGTFDFTPSNCKTNGTHRIKLTSNGYVTIEGVACAS